MNSRIGLFDFFAILSVFGSAFGGEFFQCAYPDHQKNLTFDCGALDKNVEHIEYLNSYTNSYYFCSGYQYVDTPIGDAHRIDIKNCRMPNIPQTFFQQLQEAVEIYMDRSGIQKLRGEDFPEKSEWEQLSMVFNKLIELPAYLFVHTPAIREADFSYNQIRRIDVEAFTSGTLERVKLTHNFIETLEKDLFLTAPELIEIDLSHNQIVTFHPEMLTLKRLIHLNLNNNKIVRLDCNIFPNSDTKALIDASNNQLTDVNFKCEKKSDGLALNLEGNQLESLTFPASTLMDHVYDVFAPRNQIKNISIEKEMKSLMSLSVANNMLTNVSDIFKRCTSLKRLDLSFNNVSPLGRNSLVKLKSLEYLYLSNVSLSHLEYGMFSYAQSLRVLNLSHNHLDQFHFDCFLPSLKYLNELYLNDNEINSIDGPINTILPNLYILAVSNNNMKCGYLDQFLRHLTSTHIRMLPDDTLEHDDHRTNLNGITCVNDGSAFAEKGYLKAASDGNEQTILDQSHESTSVVQTIRDCLVSLVCIAGLVLILMKLVNDLRINRQFLPKSFGHSAIYSQENVP